MSNALAIERVEAFRCLVCKRLHDTEADALECCVCTECKTKFNQPNQYGNTCDHCLYGSRLRNCRKEVKRYEELLATSQMRLAAFLSDKRPPKGTANR